MVVVEEGLANGSILAYNSDVYGANGAGGENWLPGDDNKKSFGNPSTLQNAACEDLTIDFNPDVVVTSFAIDMFDYGDWFPLGGSDPRVVKLTAYDVADSVIGTPATLSIDYDRYGNDVLQAGARTLSVSGDDIAYVTLVFEDVDPGVTFDNLQVCYETPTSGGGAESTLIEKWKSGDAAFECGEIDGIDDDYDYTFEGNVNGDALDCCVSDFHYKVDEWQETGMDGTYEEAGNTITILNSDGKTFDWTSEWPVCAVIVKAGTGAYVYCYPGGAYGDAGLVAPWGKDISHATFCFGEPEMCYQEETAWAFGDLYVTQGNWAMYVSYSGEQKIVPIYAGQNMEAGTATFTPMIDSPWVQIDIALDNGFIFYYDLADDQEDNNVKVQDYETAPTTTPAPGLFAWKAMVPVGQTTATIVVPANNFYGVHLDVAYAYDCDEGPEAEVEEEEVEIEIEDD